MYIYTYIYNTHIHKHTSRMIEALKGQPIFENAPKFSAVWPYVTAVSAHFSVTKFAMVLGARRPFYTAHACV